MKLDTECDRPDQLNMMWPLRRDHLMFPSDKTANI